MQNAYSRRMSSSPLQANLYALGAIALWASLASLGVSLTHIPPFLLTGITLIIGSVPAWPFVLRDPSQWRIPMRTLALGVYGLFAYHFLLFIALRYAPPVEANLVNYLWPLFIVVLAPVVLPGVALRVPHVVAALLGFCGAAIAIVGGRELSGTLAWGYIPAAAAAFIWATYSLMTKRVTAFPTTAIGLFGLVSGALSLLCHVLLEPSVTLQARDWGPHLHVAVVGFTSRMSDYMGVASCIVTKAGPGTIAEACCSGLPIMLSGYLPGQESGNVAFVVDGGFGAYASEPAKIASTVASWLAEPQRLAQMSERSLLAARPLATERIADDIIELIRPNRVEPRARKNLWARRRTGQTAAIDRGPVLQPA